MQNLLDNFLSFVVMFNELEARGLAHRNISLNNVFYTFD
jgi:hypothetical protein